MKLGFMGKSWDNTGIAYNVELWKECLEGSETRGAPASLLGGTRTLSPN